MKRVTQDNSGYFSFVAGACIEWLGLYDILSGLDCLKLQLNLCISQSKMLNWGCRILDSSDCSEDGHL